MSTSVMAACWPLQMPPVAKAVLISLADNANDNGVCWPAISTICRRTCLHRATVMRAISWLTTNGCIAVEHVSGHRNTYRISPESYSQPVAESDPSQSATSRTKRPDPSQRATSPVAESDTNRNEPSRTVTHTRARARERETKQNGRKSTRRTMHDALEFYERAEAGLDS